MGKRKTTIEDDGQQAKSVELQESDSDSDMDQLDVEFEYFDPQPEHDFDGIKVLLRQLFDVDAVEFDLSALTDLILAQPLLGSTVKVDGNQGDTYAFLTVLNMKEHKDKPAVQSLSNYLVSKTQKSQHNEELCTINSLLKEVSSECQIGLILSERFINVPPELGPPMYRMLLEEVTWAVDDQEPYRFSHYLIWSRLYYAVDSTLEAAAMEGSKKKKRLKKQASDQAFYFHPEDEILHEYAISHGSFQYTRHDREQSDAKRAFHDFGITSQGHLILIEAARFADAVKCINSLAPCD